MNRDSNGVRAHGADDIPGASSNYLENTRQLASKWKGNKQKETDMPPYRNAENLAMSAVGEYILSALWWGDSRLADFCRMVF